MITAIPRIFTLLATGVFLIAAGLFAYFAQPLFLLIPFGLLAGTLFLQYPSLLFYTLLAAIPWSIEYNFTPSLGTDLPDEPLMLATALASIALLFFRRRATKKIAVHPLMFLLLLQMAWALVAVLCSTDIVLSAKYLMAKCWYLLAFVGMPLLLFDDEKVLRRSMSVLLSSMMVFVVVALVRHAQSGWTFEKINDALEPFFRNHVNYSALLVFMVPLQWAIIRITPSKKLRTVVMAVFIITLIALYFSYARGAWLALVTGALAYWLIHKKALLPVFITGMVLVAVGVYGLRSNDRYLQFSSDYRSTIFHTDFREHLVATYQMKDMSTAERFHRWVAGVRMVGDYWQTGIGPSTFYRQYKSYTQPAFKTWVSRNEEQSTVHNYFLLMLVEQGVMGLLLFLALLIALFWYVQRIYHRINDPFWKAVIAAAGSVLVMQCTVNFLSDLIETDKIGSVFYLCIAIIITADLKTRAVSRR